MRARTVALCAIMVLSVVSIGGIGLGGASISAQEGPPDGMVGVPAGNLEDIRDSGATGTLSAADLEGAVYAADHAETTEVSLVTRSQADEVARGASPSAVAHEAVCSGPAGPGHPVFDCDQDQSPALVISDDVHDEGREIAIRAGVLEESVGHVPEMLTIRNNESGERWRTPVSVEEGWVVADVEHFSSNAITWGGEVSIQGEPASDGAQFDYDLGDVGDATPVVNLTGVETTGSEFASGTNLLNGSTISVDVDGNAEPVDKSVTFTGVEQFVDVGWQDPEVYSESSTDSQTMSVDLSGANTLNISGTIATSDGTATGRTYIDGTLKKETSFTDPNPGDALIDTTSENHIIDVSDYSGTHDVTLEVESDSDSASAYWRGTHFVSEPSESPGLDVDGDGTSDVEHSGNLAAGETATINFTSLSTSTTDVTILVAGAVNASVEWTERTITTDPSIEINGNMTSHSGTLGDGETTSLDIDNSWLREGTNRVNVSVGGDVGDGPTPAVGLDYRHSAETDQTVSYHGETWSERYNVSKTWGGDRSDATLSIPFASDRVVSIRDVEISRNGSAWSAVSSEDFDLDGTTLEVNLGDVSGGEETAIRANASKVRVSNGEIDVLEPTLSGQQLDSEIEVVSTAGEDPLEIDVGGTEFSDRIHYLAEESWTDSDPDVRVTASGDQTIRADAPQGSTARVQLAEALSVEPQSGDAIVRVDDPGPDPDEIQFQIRPGESKGDTIDVVYRETVRNQKYGLWSITNERDEDSATASSPVTFSITDATSTYTVQERSSGAGAPIAINDGDGGNGADPMWIVLLGVVVLGFVALAFVAQRFGDGLRSEAPDARDLVDVSISRVDVPRLPVSIPVPIPRVAASPIVAIGTAVLSVVALEMVTAESLVLEIIRSLTVEPIQTLSSGAFGAVVASIAILVGLVELHRRTRVDVPIPVFVVSGAIVVLFVVEQISDGSFVEALATGLEEIGPLVWLGIIGGGGFLLWIYLRNRGKPDTQLNLQIQGESE